VAEDAEEVVPDPPHSRLSGTASLYPPGPVTAILGG
jgi:hypothetical protein